MFVLNEIKSAADDASALEWLDLVTSLPPLHQRAAHYVNTAITVGGRAPVYGGAVVARL